MTAGIVKWSLQLQLTTVLVGHSFFLFFFLDHLCFLWAWPVLASNACFSPAQTPTRPIHIHTLSCGKTGACAVTNIDANYSYTLTPMAVCRCCCGMRAPLCRVCIQPVLRLFFQQNIPTPPRHYSIPVLHL